MRWLWHNKHEPDWSEECPRCGTLTAPLEDWPNTYKCVCSVVWFKLSEEWADALRAAATPIRPRTQVEKA